MNWSEQFLNDVEKANADWIGLEGMKQQLVEECGELIKAVCKYNRATGIGQPTSVTELEAFNNLLMEIADVRICLDHLCYLMHISDTFMENRRIEAVLKVMNRRLENE